MVADPLLLAAVTGGEGVDGAMVSSAAIPTIRTIHQSVRRDTSCRRRLFVDTSRCCCCRADFEQATKRKKTWLFI